jgi:uncharacterized protein YjdB
MNRQVPWRLAALVGLGLTAACTSSGDGPDAPGDEDAIPDTDVVEDARTDRAPDDTRDTRDAEDRVPSIVGLVVTPGTSDLRARCRADDPPVFAYLAAIAAYDDGTSRDVGAAATWRSSDETVATVEAGRVEAVATSEGEFEAEITATYDGVTSAPVVVIVRRDCLRSISLSPTTAVFTSGSAETVALTAAGQYADGSTEDLTESAAWASSDEGVATVSNDPGSRGVVSPSMWDNGFAQITATYSGITSSPSIITVMTVDGVELIEVEPASATITVDGRQPFTATARWVDGRTSDVTAAAVWDSGTTTVATIDASGTATGVGPGTTAISATFGGATGTAWLSIYGPTSPVIIFVAPPTSLIPVGMTASLSAAAEFTDGSIRDVTDSATWFSSNEAVATVDGGIVSSVSVGGPVTVRAVFAGVTGTAMVNVAPPFLVSIMVMPGVTTIPPTVTQEFRATGTLSDASSAELTLDPNLTWSSSNTSVATISNAAGSKGVATAVSTGTTTIVATYDDGVVLVSGTASLVTTSCIMTRITVAPTAATVAVGDAVALSATASFSCGVDAVMTTTCAWTSSDAAIASVAGGLVTGVAAGGPVTITATAGTLSGTAQITVVP